MSKEYGGYHFEPAGKLRFGTQFVDVKIRSYTELKLWDKNFADIHGEPSYLYNHSDFYEAMGVDDDLFRCVENGKTYVPCEHELMEFEGYADEEDRNARGKVRRIYP